MENKIKFLRKMTMCTPMLQTLLKSTSQRNIDVHRVYTPQLVYFITQHNTCIFPSRKEINKKGIR
jgi:hypothetical protein